MQQATGGWRRTQMCRRSSSTGSLYNAERAAFRKKMEKEDVQEDGPEPNDEDKARKGPPVGHAGASHGNKAERTVTLHVQQMRVRARVHLRAAVQSKDGDGSRRGHESQCIAYVIERAACKKCGGISLPIRHDSRHVVWTPDVGVHRTMPSAARTRTISYYFDALYGFKISPNAYGTRARP